MDPSASSGVGQTAQAVEGAGRQAVGTAEGLGYQGRRRLENGGR